MADEMKPSSKVPSLRVTHLRHDLLVRAVSDLLRHLDTVRYYDSTGRPLRDQPELSEVRGQMHLINEERNPDPYRF
jgi:hypothetical protein